MRRYLVVLRGYNFNKMESFTDYEEAKDIARKWRICYEGVITIKDNMTGKVEAV